MRLLKLGRCGRLTLTKDFVGKPPCYAILSHTWGSDDDEVTFQDLQNGSGESKAGYRKIRFCGEQAKRDGLQYFWVDTCAINKLDFTELSEAITSMYRWYREAAKCYVYLSDVSVSHDTNNLSNQTWELAFRKSQWFTRGWTLQELIAPRSVEFFSRDEDFLGDKKTLGQQIHEITGVPISALHGASLSSFSVDERLRWAKDRQTRKIEDKAYCLLGIFNVFMPLIYGEGEHAFVRLKAEINGSSRRLLNPIETKHDLDKCGKATKKSPDNLHATDGVLDTPGLLRLFSSCLDSYRLIQRGHPSEKKFTVLETKFSNQELRLITWGRACGLIDEFEYDTRLDEPELWSRIIETLECIRQLFLDEAELSKKYGLKRNKRKPASQSEGTMEPGSSVRSTRPSVGLFFSWKRELSLQESAVWVISDENKFSRMVKHLKDFNDDLESLTRQTSIPIRQQGLVEREIKEIKDPEMLSIIEQAGQEDSDIVSDTASVRLGSVRDGSIYSFPSVSSDSASFMTAHSNPSSSRIAADSILPATSKIVMNTGSSGNSTTPTTLQKFKRLGSYKPRRTPSKWGSFLLSKLSIVLSRRGSKTALGYCNYNGHMVNVVGWVEITFRWAESNSSGPEEATATFSVVESLPSYNMPKPSGREMLMGLVPSAPRPWNHRDTATRSQSTEKKRRRKLFELLARGVEGTRCRRLPVRCLLSTNNGQV